MDLTFIDTETTGIKEEDVIIQLALIQEVDGKVVNSVNSFYSNGDRKISLFSKATHGILEDMIKDFPIFSPGVKEYVLIESIKKDTIFVGHNVQFDIGMLAKSGCIIECYIDTLQIARHLMQDEEDEFENSYRQEILKYYLMEKGIAFPEAKAHDAMGDVQTMIQIFKYLFNLTKTAFNLESEDDIIEKMLEMTNSPILLKRINFGKYKGMSFEEIARTDTKYLDWLCGTTYDENVKFTCERWI